MQIRVERYSYDHVITSSFRARHSVYVRAVEREGEINLGEHSPVRATFDTWVLKSTLLHDAVAWFFRTVCDTDGPTVVSRVRTRCACPDRACSAQIGMTEIER